MALLLTVALTTLLTALAVSIDWRPLLKGGHAVEQRRLRSAKGRKKKRMLNAMMLIDVSGVRLALPFYNLAVHMLLSAFCAGLLYLLFAPAAGSLLSIFCLPAGYLVPSLLLRLAADTMEFRLRKYYPHFLIGYGQYYCITNNLFEAFRMMSENYMVEPLKSHVSRMIEDYDAKILPDRCLRELRCKIHNPELKTFLRGLELVYRKGGDVELLIEKTIQAMESINLSDGKAEAEMVTLRMGMYLVLAANFGLLSYMMAGPYWRQVAGSLWGMSMFAVNVLFAAGVVAMILQQGNFKEVADVYERLE